MVIRYLAHEAYAPRNTKHESVAELYATCHEASPDWELLAPHPLALVCFRACPSSVKDLDALNEAIMHGVNASGRALLSHTRLHDKLTLRLSIGNIRTTEKHVRQVWELLNHELRRNNEVKYS
jgi:aromatic-L-amino-acid decarboxylase